MSDTWILSDGGDHEPYVASFEDTANGVWCDWTFDESEAKSYTTLEAAKVDAAIVGFNVAPVLCVGSLESRIQKTITTLTGLEERHRMSVAMPDDMQEHFANAYVIALRLVREALAGAPLPQLTYDCCVGLCVHRSP